MGENEDAEEQPNRGFALSDDLQATSSIRLRSLSAFHPSDGSPNAEVERSLTMNQDAFRGVKALFLSPKRPK